MHLKTLLTFIGFYLLAGLVFSFLLCDDLLKFGGSDENPVACAVTSWPFWLLWVVSAGRLVFGGVWIAFVPFIILLAGVIGPHVIYWRRRKKRAGIPP